MNWPFGHLTPYKYGALLIDFPLHYEMRSEDGYGKSPEKHYATMSEDQIARLPLRMLAAQDCLAWVWSTWPHVPLVLRIMQAQGFRYRTGGSWTKTTRSGKRCFGTGFILRATTEPFLIFAMGDPVIGSASVRNLIESERREHSRKPPEARAMLAALRPDCHIAELFARESWPGHDVWGWEQDKFDDRVTGEVAA